MIMGKRGAPPNAGSSPPSPKKASTTTTTTPATSSLEPSRRSLRSTNRHPSEEAAPPTLAKQSAPPTAAVGGGTRSRGGGRVVMIEQKDVHSDVQLSEADTQPIQVQVVSIERQQEHELSEETDDDSQIFEAVAKMNAEEAQQRDQGPGTTTAVITMDEQQRSAVESILGGSGVTVIPVTEVETADGTEVREYIPMEGGQVVQAVDVPNPAWNEQGCIVCNVDVNLEDPSHQTPKHEQLKEFFLEFFSVGDQISLEEENAFPFCTKCADEMDGLRTISQNVETMHKQFNRARDGMAKKTIKTFLSRSKPNYLEEDAKAENYGYLDEDQKKSYKEQMFNLWKSRYELVQPGPKTPIMIRSMDSRGRVTVVRLNSHGQAVPDKFGGNRGGIIRTDSSLGVMTRLLTNGDDNDDDGCEMEDVDMYQCKDCPKAFSTKSLLSFHSRVHTGELPYECDQCGKAFSLIQYRDSHMKTHSEEKPYKCGECGRGFAQRGGLVTHALVHSGAKPFRCQICGKSFRQKYHLTQHNLVHSGVKPFPCDLCGKAFNVKMNLREHMRRHTGDRPYKCPYCITIGFFRKRMLKDHITKAHPQRPMPEELMTPEPYESHGGDDDGQDYDEEYFEDELEEAEDFTPDDDHTQVFKNIEKATT